MQPSLIRSPVSAKPVRADRPPRPISVIVHWRGRKMILMQRPQRRLSALWCTMLRRSWMSLFGAMATAALAFGSASAAAAAATVTDTTLPAGAVVQAGQAAISQTGNQMTVLQGTNKAIIDWQSFSIGAKAGVTFVQPSSSAVALNRVVGNDPSQLLGSLTANGKVFLINAAGIMVGKDATIDVAGFAASTLKISNEDFLANKLTFNADPGVAAAAVQNNGTITTPEGGSVYLIGSSVINNGIIRTPGGETLLAAGSSVQLVDTGTPGVTINVTGAEGNVTNLGQIVSAAGRIGIGAALIDNSGTLNASSVEKEGGRIFLRASKQLTTDATSQISADGKTGGNVVLYSDQKADIGGDVSALGSAGSGGYVDTSGKTSLTVKYTPRVGLGGKWLIDPYGIQIGDSSTGDVDGDNVITSIGANAKIRASTISDMLNAGTSVSIVTGDNGTQLGDITVNTSVTKTAGDAATLTLNAQHNIYLNADIGNSNSGLSLNITAGGAIAQTAGAIVANNLSANAATGIALNGSGNKVANFSANNTGSGNIVLTNGVDLALGNITNNHGDVTVSNLGGTVTTSGLINAGGTVGLTSWGRLEVGGTGIGAQNINLTSTSRESIDDIAVNGALTATGTINLTSANAITQSGAITAATLNASAVAGIGLTSSSNSVANFGASNTGSGDIALTSGGTVTVGTITNSASGGSINITAGGAIAQLTSGAIVGNSLSANAATGIALNGSGNNVTNFSASNTGSGDIVLNNGTGLMLGNISNAAGNVTIGVADSVVLQGEISSLTVGGTLSVTAAGGMNLTGGNNSVANFKAVNTGAGDIRLTSKGTVTLGTITNFASGGNINIVAGAIAQSTAGAVVGDNLSANAATGIVLNSSGNKVGNFSASNTGSGNIEFKNITVGTSVNKLGAVHNDGGNITIDNTGALETIGLIDAPLGTVSLVTHSPLTIGAAGVSANGNINLTAGYTASASDNLTLNGAIASTGGSVVMYAGNNILANAAISAPSGAVSGSTVTGTVIQGVGYSVDSPVSPVYSIVSPPGSGSASSPATPTVIVPAAVSTVDQNVATTQSAASGNGNVETASTVSTVAATTTSARSSDAGQTTGGAAGTFGGSSEDDKKDDSKINSSKSLPVCT